MKTRVVSLLILYACGLTHAEYLYDDFEHYPTGVSITAQDGWSRLGTMGPSARMVTDPVHSGRQALTLHHPTGSPSFMTNCVAAYTNFIHTYAPASHPIITASAMLYRQNVNQQVEMSLGYNGTDVVTVKSNPGKTRIVVNNYTTGVNFVVGQYADLVLRYDLHNNLTSLDYNGTNVMPWTYTGTPVTTHLNMFAMRRTSFGFGTEGTVAFDKVCVETFPSKTWSHWRFEKRTHQHTADRTGRFTPARRRNPSLSDWVAPPWDGLSSQGYVHHNHSALRAFAHEPCDAKRVFPATFDWTVEAILSMHPNFSGVGIKVFELSRHTQPTSQDDTWISISWDASGAVECRLREAGSGSSTYQTINWPDILPVDGNWHHLGVVKSAEIIYFYGDYVPKGSQALNTVANGSYEFGTDTSVSIGNELDGGYAAPITVMIDELRISNDNLGAGSFLGLAQSYFTENIEMRPVSPWYLTATTQPNKQYRAYMNTGLGSGAIWNPNGATFRATQFISRVQANMPAHRAGAFRLEEQ